MVSTKIKHRESNGEMAVLKRRIAELEDLQVKCHPAGTASADDGEKYRAIFESANDIILLMDKQGKIIDVNRRLKEISGYEDQELLGKNIKALTRIMTKGSLAVIVKNFLKRMAGVSVPNYEVEMIKKDGSHITVEISAHALCQNGRIIGDLAILRDITERKKAEEKYRTVTAAALDGFWLCDTHNRFLEANDSYLKMIGYTREELLKMSIYDVEANFTREEVEEKTKKVIQRGHDRFITRHRRKDGSIIDVEISVNYIDMDGGRLSVFVRDITERKRAQEAMERDAIRRRILVDGSRDGIVVLREDGTVYESNKKFNQMVGYSSQELENLHVWDWDCRLSQEQLLSKISHADEAGEILETQHQRKDGTVYDVEISNSAATFSGQKLIFSVCRDITERKRAEESLRQAYDIINRSHIVAFLWCKDKDWPVEFVTQNVADLLGYTAEEFVSGKVAYTDIIHPDDLKRVRLEGRAVSGDRFEHEPYRITTKSGQEIWVSQKTERIRDAEGNVSHYQGVIQDVTQKKQMQEQLILADRLSSVGELASGIAHELNNPLTGIIGISELLLKKEVPDYCRQDLDLVHSEAQRAAQVVRNLLTFARKHPAGKQMVDINEVLLKVMELRTYEERIDNIEVVHHLADDLPHVSADFFQLQQCFLNIVINAEFFMIEAHDGGRLIIATERLGDKVRALIADDGPGISKDNLKHVFDPFFTTKDVGKGTGLGLSICHGIIAEQGGNIYAESQLGQGATFIVELPVAEDDSMQVER